MSKTRVDFKHRMLKLLREDEEFRYAVVGLLGIEDIRSGQARLEQAHVRLEEAVAKLEHAVAKLTERQDRLEEAIVKLTERHERLEEAFTNLAERQSRLEEAVLRLAERQDRLEEAFTNLAERQSRLEQAVGSLEQAVGRLAEAQARTEIAIQELSRQVSFLTVRFNELSTQVSKLSDTVGFGLEDIARVVVPGWLYRHEGIVVDELVRRFFIVDGEEVEVNLYGEGLRDSVKVVVLGEVKSRIYERDVKDFDRLMEKLSSLFAAENVYKLMFGYYIHPSAEREAEKRKITLIASYMR
jgi:prefoldin subunit 5